MNNKAIAAVAGVAVLGLVGYVGYEVYKSKKQTAAIRAQAAKDIAEIEAGTARVWREHAVRMQELRDERALTKKKHEELMGVIEQARLDDVKLHAGNMHIINDLSKGYITAAEAVRLLRTLTPPKKTRLRAVA